MTSTAGTRSNPTVLHLSGDYTITNTTRFTLDDKHIHLKVPAGETATIQVTGTLSAPAFHLRGSTLILGEPLGGGTLIIDGGKDSGITNPLALIAIDVRESNSQGSYGEINQGVAIRNNKTSDNGGAILINGKSGKESTLKITGGTISGNSVPGSNKSGGGIYMIANSNLVMTGGIIENNSAADGGGIYSYNGTLKTDVESWPIITISGGEIRNNTATASGGGIRSHGKTTISGTARIHHNGAAYGGGISRFDDTDPSASGNNTLTFTPNAWSSYVYDNTATGGDPQVSNP